MSCKKSNPLTMTSPMKIFLTFTLSLICITSLGQSSFVERITIDGFENLNYKGVHYKSVSQQLKLLQTFNRPELLPLFGKYATYRHTGNQLMILGGIAIALGLTEKPIVEKGIKKPLSMLGGATALVGLAFGMKASNLLKETVNLYNKEAVIANVELQPIIETTNDGIQLGMEIRF